MELKTFELRTVLAFARSFEGLFDRCDSEGMSEYYTNDARLLAEETASIEGRQAIKNFW
jgi:ketosteroid isomerase-like protein